MPQPLLTVVIPVYNVEKYLRECLDSIINQTYTNLEIIIVNDCSPDNSEAIILEYQAKDPRIKYIKHEKNLRQGGARNTGITNATGEWITFMDSDDYIDLDTYQTMMDLILKNNVDMGVWNGVEFDDNTKKEIACYYHFISTPTKLQDVLPIWSSIYNKIFRLSDIIDNDILFPIKYAYEDVAFWFKYTTTNPTIIGCNKKFYHYRQRENSTVTKKDVNFDVVYIMQDMYEYLIEKNIFDKNQHRFFRQLNAWCTIRDLSADTHIKLLTIFHDFLQQFPDDMLLPYDRVFAVKNITINEYSLDFLKNISTPQHSYWYRFGRLSFKDKIKFIIKNTIKKILIKLRLFGLLKYFLKYIKIIY